MERLWKLVGLDPEVPDFNTLCRRQKTLSVAISYQGARGPLNLLIDSTGIKAPSRQHPAQYAADHCMQLRGQRLAALNFGRQVAEIQIRTAMLNGLTALGIPRTISAG